MNDVWWLVAALAASTVALRAAGPVLAGGRPLRRGAAGAVELLAPVLFAALIVTQVFAAGEDLVLDERAGGLAAAAAAIALRAPAYLVLVSAAAATAVLRLALG